MAEKELNIIDQGGQQNVSSTMYQYSRTFPSSISIIKDLEQDIINIQNVLQLNEQIYYNLIVIITEGFNNASKHGNNYDKDKAVKLEIIVKSYYENKISIEISIFDQGQGFDINKVEDPRLPENLLKSGGRGVFLIKELSNFVSYEKLSNNSNKLFVILEC